jgi:hypothetical protein
MSRLILRDDEDFAAVETPDGAIRVAVRTAIANVVSLLRFVPRPIRVLPFECDCGRTHLIRIYADDRLTIEQREPPEVK